MKDMQGVSRHLDATLLGLKDAFTSVDSLMPRQDLKPHAMEIMNGVLQEIRELKENTGLVKTELQLMLTSAQQENEKTRIAIKEMEDGVNQIEKVLSQFGYEASKMPAYVSTEEPTEDAEDVESGDDSMQLTGGQSFENATSHREPEQVISSPQRQSYMSELNESMAGVEITPMVLSNRSSHSYSHARSPRSPFVPVTSQGMRNLMKNESYQSTSPLHRLLYANKENRIQEAEKKEKPKVDATRVLVKPSRPILSKTTYDILGEQPPAEFYEQQVNKS